MKTAWALLLISCTYVVVTPRPIPKEGCPTEDIPFADIVYVTRLSRRIVGLSSAITSLDLALTAAISRRKVAVGHVLGVPLVPEADAAGALYFSSCEQKAPASLGTVLEYFSRPLTSNNKTDCELADLARTTGQFDSLVPYYPSGLLGSSPPPSATPFFGKAPRYLLVVVIDPQGREHDYSQCGDLAGMYGGDAWVRYADKLDKDKIFFLEIATNESLEGDAAFRQECLGMEGFPAAAIDALSPSTKFFFRDFNKAFPDQRAQMLEMCEAMAGDGLMKLDAYIKKVHGRVGLPED